MTQSRILLVDDDADIALIIKDNLELDGYFVSVASNGKTALSFFGSDNFDLIILDLSLPDMDGLQICRVIREKSAIPVIMLTARDRVPDKVLGFECGADDYVVKPFDYLELAARIKACLRRRVPDTPACQVIQVGEIKIDTAKNMVWKNDDPINLTKREFLLLSFMARNSGKVLDRRLIREKIWPKAELYNDSRSIDVHIQHLRSKLEEKPANPKYIRTVQGVGYIFCGDEE